MAEESFRILKKSLTQGSSNRVKRVPHDTRLGLRVRHSAARQRRANYNSHHSARRAAPIVRSHKRPFTRQSRVGRLVCLGFSVCSGPHPSSAIPGLSLAATGAAPAGAASRGGKMLSAARRIQAYWPSRAESRKATWFSGAVEEAGPCVGHALLHAQALAALCCGVTGE